MQMPVRHRLYHRLVPALRLTRGTGANCLVGQPLEEMPGDKCQGLGSSSLCPELKGNEGWVAPCHTESWPQSWGRNPGLGVPSLYSALHEALGRPDWGFFKRVLLNDWGFPHPLTGSPQV